MQIAMIGVNHKTAPVAVREALAVPAGAMPAALARFHDVGVAEAVLLSTCNRTEVYAVGTDGAAVYALLTDYLVDLAAQFNGQQPPGGWLEPSLYRHEGLEAVEHLFRVTAGLDSMVIGETQILGQVRDAYREATAAGTVGKVLHQFFEQGIAVGKRAQTETRIGQSAVSVSYAAVELARKVFQSLANRSCLAIGAGETAKLTVRHLLSGGVGEIIIANRTLERAQTLAQQLAQQIKGRALPMDAIPQALREVDVVISSTGAPGYVVTRQQVQEAMRHRRGRPIFLFDIAVPRDLDPEIGRIDGAFLYDLDDLQAVVAANLAEREQEAAQVERIVADEVGRFRSWLAALDVVPTIRMLREKVEAIREQELARALSRLPDLSERERAVVAAMTVTLVNKILNAPTQQLKGMADEGAATQALETITRLFDLPGGT